MVTPGLFRRSRSGHSPWVVSDSVDPNPPPPWAELPALRYAATSDGGRGGLGGSERPAADQQVEQAMRWRLVLGRYAGDRLGQQRLKSFYAADDDDQHGEGEQVGGDDPMGEAPAPDLAELLAEGERLDGALEYIYDREYARRAHRTAGGGRSAGLSVPAWLNDVRDLFPAEAAHVMQHDALRRYGMTELVTDPELLRQAEPSEALLKAILQFKHMMTGEVLEAAREVVGGIVDGISERLLDQTRAALTGGQEPLMTPPARTFRNTDWKKTILRNLKHYDHERARLLADTIFYKHRTKRRSPWTVIVAVDQSGSMMDSLIHSAVMAAIFAALPSVTAHLVLWDTRVVDVSDMVDDPMAVLMSCQLGGGTEMYPAMQYCAGLIREPDKTIFVLISDWYIWGEADRCLALAHELTEAGVRGVGLCALDADARPVHDQKFARELAGCGWFVASLTPKRLAEHIGKIIA